MLCKGSSLLVTGALQWLQRHTQTPRGHPDFCPLLLLVLLVSWKQEDSMMSFSSAVMFFSKFVCSGLPVQGPSEGHLQLLTQVNQTPLVLWPRHLWGVVGTHTCSEQAEKTTLLLHMLRARQTLHISPFCWEKPLVRMGWQLEEVPSANTWAEGMEQAASRPQPHLDPSRSVSGERQESREEGSCSSVSSSDILCFPVMWFAFVFFHVETLLSKPSMGMSVSGHDVIASMPLPPATRQLLTKWEILRGLLWLWQVYFSPACR